MVATPYPCDKQDDVDQHRKRKSLPPRSGSRGRHSSSISSDESTRGWETQVYCCELLQANETWGGGSPVGPRALREATAETLQVDRQAKRQAKRDTSSGEHNDGLLARCNHNLQDQGEGETIEHGERMLSTPDKHEPIYSKNRTFLQQQRHALAEEAHRWRAGWISRDPSRAGLGLVDDGNGAQIPRLQWQLLHTMTQAGKKTRILSSMKPELNSISFENANEAEYGEIWPKEMYSTAPDPKELEMKLRRVQAEQRAAETRPATLPRRSGKRRPQVQVS